MERIKYTKAITNVVEQLSSEDSYRFMFHKHRSGGPVPSVDGLKQIVELCRAIVFPGFYGNVTMDSNLLKYHIGMYTEKLFELLKHEIHAGLCFCEDMDCSVSPLKSWSDQRRMAADKAVQFVEWLPQLRSMLAEDVMSMYDGDPAASSFGEIISCYPTVRAVSNYRIAHKLVLLEVPLIPRIITELAHGETGIDIHPGATIGHHFTIDHGTGVVIGETCVIGDNVKIYQGVTLGAKNFKLDDDGNPIKGIPRHPIIEDDVIIYANATVLGRVTIGAGSIIGGNMWVTESIAPGTVLIQGRSKV